MRRGVTLIELLLVLAVLVIVAGLAVPNLNAFLEGQRLRKSGDLIHAEWAKARNLSMKTGRLHVFRCKLGLDEYEIRPWYAADDALESSHGAGGTGEPLGGQGDLAVNGIRRLPAGIVFAEGLAEDDARSAGVHQAMGDSTAGGWGQPIMFYADGTSSTARVLLSNRRHQYVRLDLRGLTGLTEVSSLLTQTEAMQQP